MTLGMFSTSLPFGIQSDAMSNIKAFEARVDNMYKSLEETFLEFDSDESGEVDFKEFRSAMEKLREEKVLHTTRAGDLCQILHMPCQLSRCSLLPRGFI